MEIPCAHYELRSVLFSNMGMKYSLFPCEVSGGYLLAFVVVAKFQGLTDPCGIWGRQRGTGTGFSPNTLSFRLRLIFHHFHFILQSCC
jgi:hypothetical protein